MKTDPPRRRWHGTDDEAHRAQVAVYRRMTFGEKYRTIQRLNRRADELALAGLRARHANATDAELRRRLIGLKLGKDLARAAFGRAPDDLV